MSSSRSTRISYKRTRPNPLFQEWLEELYEEAKETNDRLEDMLKEALESISKYPLPLKSGAECIILKGFKKQLCSFLDKRLKVYNYNLALQQSEEHSASCSSSSGTNTNSSSATSDIVKIENRNDVQSSPTSSLSSVSVNLGSRINLSGATNRNIARPTTPVQQNTNNPKEKQYKPLHRSGSYAIIIALYEQHKANPSVLLTKEELINKAQIHSEESFTRPKPNTYYTAWSNITRLITKGLVHKVIKNKHIRYSISTNAIVLAEELLEDSKNIPTINDVIFHDGPSTSTASASNMYVLNGASSNLLNTAISDTDTQVLNKADSNVTDIDNNSIIELPAGSFDIILLIDKNETSGSSKKTDPTVAQFNKYPDLNHEYRSLKVGDFTWIARHKVNKEHELVIPYIMERKRMDDLGASIKDGRFNEQKFRLRKCGLKNVVYLIENYGSNKHVGLPLQSLMQSLANTRVQDNFKVHVTDSLTNSARFLAMMTKRLTIRFKDKTLKGCNSDPTEDHLMTFEYFNKSSLKTKPLTVKETFIKLLLQLKGVSVEKALAITTKYHTPRSLIVQYQKCDRNEGEYLLANIKYGITNRNLGPAVSKSVYQLFSKTGPR